MPNYITQQTDKACFCICLTNFSIYLYNLVLLKTFISMVLNTGSSKLTHLVHYKIYQPVIKVNMDSPSYCFPNGKSVSLIQGCHVKILKCCEGLRVEVNVRCYHDTKILGFP